MRVRDEDARVVRLGARVECLGGCFAEQEVDSVLKAGEVAPTSSALLSVPGPVVFFVHVASVLEHRSPLVAVGGCVDPVGLWKARLGGDLLKRAAGACCRCRVGDVAAVDLRHPFSTDEVPEGLVVSQAVADGAEALLDNESGEQGNGTVLEDLHMVLT